MAQIECKTCKKMFEVKLPQFCCIKCKAEFQKGKPSWNKGQVFDEATKKRISEAVKKTFKDGTRKKRISQQMKEQYKYGVRDRIDAPKKAHEVMKLRTLEKEKTGNMTAMIDAHGYKLVYTTHGWRKEHQLIWEKNNGKIPEGFHIHHINGNKQDNRIENLLLVHKSEHLKKYHNIGRDENGRFKKS